MGLGWFKRDEQHTCGKDFPQLWTRFVDSFIDSINAQGPAAAPPQQPQSQAAPGPTFLPAVRRLVAIGDLHGDLAKARRAFRLGGLIDDHDRWVGGDTTAVQVGDLLDRGDNELAVLFWLERLQREARRAGGALHVLNGNHETLNVSGRFRYATLGGCADFMRFSIVQRLGNGLKARCDCGVQMRSSPAMPAELRQHKAVDGGVAARWEALSPGGAVTQRFLADHPVVLQVGSTVLVHGGVLPEHAAYGLDRINQETREWMRGSPEARMPRFLAGRNAVVWAREYSAEDAARCDCDSLRTALGMIPGAKRMVVGHTIQDEGINSACNDQVYRIDVGLSKGCGDGLPEVLEILNDSEVRRLREKVAAADNAVQGGWQTAVGQGLSHGIV